MNAGRRWPASAPARGAPCRLDGGRPKAAQAGHDLNYIGLSGALWYASAPDDIPIAPATLVGDIGGGAMYLTVGMLAGLLKARATGAGCVVDAAIVDGSAHMMNLLMSLRSSGGFRTMRGQSLLDGPHWSRVYRCGDGGYFTVQALESKFYAQFLDLMGLAGDVDFTDQFDQTRWPVLTRRLAQIVVRFTERILFLFTKTLFKKNFWPYYKKIFFKHKN